MSYLYKHIKKLVFHLLYYDTRNGKNQLYRMSSEEFLIR